MFSLKIALRSDLGLLNSNHHTVMTLIMGLICGGAKHRKTLNSTY